MGAGCAQLAGIDETSDRNRGGNSAAVVQRSIGTRVVDGALDLTGLQATYLVANVDSPTGFDRVRAGDAGQGTWTVDLPEVAPVIVTLPGVPSPVPVLFALPSRALTVLHSVLEHPGRSPAPEGAMLNVKLTLDAAVADTDALQVFTVGAWTARNISPAELPVGSTMLDLTYPYISATSLSGRPELDRLTVDDTFLILRYSGALLTGFAEAPAFDQTGNDIVSATMMTPVPATEQLAVTFDAPRLVTRFAAARPAVSGFSISWSLVAAPGYEVPQSSGPTLNRGLLDATALGVTASYGNPFAMRGWKTIFSLQAQMTRVYTPPGTMTPVTLSAGMSQLLDPPPPGFGLTLPAGLPAVISIDGTLLSTDGQTIAPPSKFVEVTFAADTPVAGMPNATLFSLTVFDLLPNAVATGLEYRRVFSALGAEPRFALPPEIFQAGHSYTLRAACLLGGFPRIGEGDLVTRELPQAQSFLDSAVFTVVP
jgi:hypothetical protein